MPIEFEKKIDLTEYAGNSPPPIVRQLSIVHEAKDGEIVQYYLTQGNHSQRDKCSHAVGVYNKDTDTWSFYDYDEIEWSEQEQRITGAPVERLGVKAFPGMGAYGFYKMLHRNLSRVVIPINRQDNTNEPPTLEAVINTDGSITCTITPPGSPDYECYRIVLQNGIYAEDYITYETELTVPRPMISGEYYCYCIGYDDEGQVYSKDSNVVTLTLTGEKEAYARPFYSKTELSSLEERIAALEGGEIAGQAVDPEDESEGFAGQAVDPEDESEGFAGQAEDENGG